MRAYRSVGCCPALRVLHASNVEIALAILWSERYTAKLRLELSTALQHAGAASSLPEPSLCTDIELRHDDRLAHLPAHASLFRSWHWHCSRHRHDTTLQPTHTPGVSGALIARSHVQSEAQPVRLDLNRLS